MPYGEKSKEQLIEFSKKAFEFFESKRVKAVIMACNTTSAIVYDELKDKYNFKLYPLIQSVAKILAAENYESIGVFATPATISSGAYSKNISKYNHDIKVFEIACPEWVKIVENDEINKPETFDSVGKYMTEMLKNNPQKIVLGCTHYPFLSDVLLKFAEEDIFINPAEAYVKYIKDDLSKSNLLKYLQNKGNDEFYVSSEPEKFIASGRKFYDVNDCKLMV